MAAYAEAIKLVVITFAPREYWNYNLYQEVVKVSVEDDLSGTDVSGTRVPQTMN